MICSKCGAQIPDDSKFCGICGNNVTADNGNPVPPQPTTEETVNTPAPEATDAIPTPVSPAPEAADTAPVEEVSSSAADSNPQPTADTTTQQGTPNYYGYNPNPQPGPQNNASNGGFNQAPNWNTPAGNPEDKASKTGLIMLGAIAIVAIIVVIFLFNLIFGGNSWKSVIKDKIKYLNSQDDDIKDYYITTYGEICGEFNYEQDKLLAKLLDNDDWEDDVLDTIEDTYDSFENLYGEDWDIDYEIRSKKALSDSKLDDAQDSWEAAVEDLEDTLDMLENIEDPEDYNDEFDEDDLEDLIKFYEKWIKKLEDKEVKKGYQVKYKLTIEGDDDEASNSTTVKILKIGGDWVNDSFYFSYPSFY